MEKPKDLIEYSEWVTREFGDNFDSEHNENRYNSNVTNIVNAISSRPFFLGLEENIDDWGAEYYRNTASELLMLKQDIQIKHKPYKSVIDKTFRFNILWNKKYPKEPDKGWIKPDNIFDKINDIVRSSLVCKFIDGPKFICEKLCNYADTLGLNNKYYSQEREQGYYAYHFYVEDNIEILDMNWKKVSVNVNYEIQITTQLQEILKELTHQYFERSRLLPDDRDSSWKWDYSSGKFRASYMSHTLHLLEAIILDIRTEKSK